jgi:YD repeat-containing protein
LLSALASVAYSTDIIDRMICYTDDIKGFTVFKILGHFVYVDHHVPVLINHDGTSEIIAPKLSKELEYWPILVEKCFLKMMSSNICPLEIYNFNLKRRRSKGVLHRGPDYIDINGGFPRWAICLLLGTRIDPIRTKFMPDIIKALECETDEILVGCACTSIEHDDSHVDEEGFVYGHAYSILRTDPQKQLIRVRNPWGQVESTKYDDDGISNGKNWKDDGEFFVDVHDFKEKFPVICFAKLKKHEVRLKSRYGLL